MEDPRRRRFEELYREHERPVRAYALRRATPDAAQDVVAETFLVAWRRLDELPDAALPWLYGTARKVLANQRRSAGHQRRIADRLAAEPPRLSDDPGEALGRTEEVRRALSRLGETDRETLMLVAWEGLGADAAARASGCARPTFAVRLHRARRRLERELRRAAPSPTTTITETT